MSRAINCLALILVFIAPSICDAIVHLGLEDPFDDWDVLKFAKEQAAVKGFSAMLERFREELGRFPERDLEALLGKETKIPESDKYALPTAEYRAVILSGFGGLKQRYTRSYLIGKNGRIDVYYRNGRTSHVHFYLKPDNDFVSLKQVDAIEKRLAWELPRFKEMMDYYEARRLVLFPWQVDIEEAKTIHSGIHSGEPVERLKALKEWGARNGYQHEVYTKNGYDNHTWWHGNAIAAETTPYYGYLAQDGICRYFQGHTLTWRRINDEQSNVRMESGSMKGDLWVPDGWAWFLSGKTWRIEEDDNGDGIPDTYKDDGNQVLRPLSLGESWAVHPELIPPECRLLDQPDRRVPLKKAERKR